MIKIIFHFLALAATSWTPNQRRGGCPSSCTWATAAPSPCRWRWCATGVNRLSAGGARRRCATTSGSVRAKSCAITARSSSCPGSGDWCCRRRATAGRTTGTKAPSSPSTSGSAQPRASRPSGKPTLNSISKTISWNETSGFVFFGNYEL